LAPSWDKYGFIYLVTLKGQSHPHPQQLIPPYNTLVENLPQEYCSLFTSVQTVVHQPAKGLEQLAKI